MFVDWGKSDYQVAGCITLNSILHDSSSKVVYWSTLQANKWNN